MTFLHALFQLRATKGSDLGAKLAVATSTVAASVDQESDMSSERMENARVPRWSGGHSCTEDSSELFRPRYMYVYLATQTLNLNNTE